MAHLLENGVSFFLDKGERIGLVGESGAGKSVTGFAIINLISKPGYISGGKVLFEGKALNQLSAEEMRDLRGNRISMIFQDPMMTLNPVLTIGTQMVETLQAHGDISTKRAQAVALEKLQKVQIPSPGKRLKQYPHEFSGGMRQRIVIAIALLTSPSLIIADEPSTALDVTIQAEIMDLLLELCETEKMGLILITHDLAVVSQGLIKAIPGSLQPGTRLNQIPGMMPTLTDIPPGCAFHPRCEIGRAVCKIEVPPLISIAGHDRMAACHMVGQ